MNAIDKLAEKYAWVVDAYVWFQVVGTIVGLAIFAVVGICMLKGFRRIKIERELREKEHEERRRQIKEQHEEIKNSIRQKKWDFKNK